MGLFFYELTTRSKLSIARFGFKFFVGDTWDPVSGDFGALPFIYGTLVSSLVALVLAVPMAVGVAVFVTELCPRYLRGIISFTVELLAAIPSVIYGCGESSSWCPFCTMLCSPG
jgi:phosphate transport system permease protein